MGYWSRSVDVRPHRLILLISLLLAALATGKLSTAGDEQLQQLAEKFQDRAQSERARAIEFANRAGIPLRRALPNGRVLELQRLVPGMGPIFYVTDNLGAADTVSTDDVWPGGLAGFNLEGSGFIVGEWDGGAVHPLHGDLPNVTQVDGATEISGHATHVAGTLVGAGSYPPARGMASAAGLHAYDWNNDASEMATAAAGGLLLSNHSYGAAAGWVYIGDAEPNRWWWIGGSGDEDPKFGFYGQISRDWDLIAYQAPDYLVVKSAGNDRTDFGPAPGETYTIVDDNGNPLGTSTQQRPADCAPLGFDCLALHSVAKNILTIGAVDDIQGGYSPLVGPAQVSMAPFSAWGPTDDGRIKPDLVANGVLLLSTWINEFSPYAIATGTSMSAANVTGSLLLLQEHHEDLKGPGNFLRAASLKAVAIHTADEAGDGDGPDYQHGWGLLNTRKAAELISDAHIGIDHQIIENTLADGGNFSVPVQVLVAGSVIRASLTWADPPANPVPYALDPTDSMLVNDLDLRVVVGQTEYAPWVLDPAAPAAVATRGDNVRDNVEQVVTDALGAGSYTVEVTHKGQLLELDELEQLVPGAQDFSLIVSVLPAPPTGSNNVFNVDFNGGLPAGWSVQTDYGKDWEIFTPQPGSNRYDNFTPGSGDFAMVDNLYAVTRTSLQSPVMDLSGYAGLILTFDSCFLFYLLESINIDASTDGGQNWTNIWSQLGVVHCPTQYALDLSSLAGETSVMLRWRFDSGGDSYGDYWQIDTLVLDGVGGGSGSEDPPGPASNPSPIDGAIDIDVNTQLAWGAAVDADSHDVYFGINPTPGIAEFQGNQPSTSFDPGTLADSTNYYWHIDEVNPYGTTQGPVWSFQTADPVTAVTMHLDGLSADSAEAPRGRWDAAVTISVADDLGQALAGVLMGGSWSNGANGSASCTTDNSGDCIVNKSGIKNNTDSVTFSVDALTLAGHSYDENANTVGASIVVGKPQPNLLPQAADDFYATPVDTVLNENVMSNDTVGEAPTTVTAWDTSSLTGGSLTGTASDGSFTYLPSGGFIGTDSFTYTLTDGNGDSSSATVTITVGEPAVERSLILSTSKYRGNNLVTLQWSGFTGSTVDIYRNGVLAANDEPNDGNWQDNLGKGVSGTYLYEVCETVVVTNCANASVSF